MNLYDSLQAKTLHPELREQLLALYGSTKTHINLVPVQVQVGLMDCGCFAVAFAVSLMLGDDPSTLFYRQKEMRGHLADCLINGCFTPFPGTVKKCRKKNIVLEL